MNTLRAFCAALALTLSAAISQAQTLGGVTTTSGKGWTSTYAPDINDDFSKLYATPFLTLGAQTTFTTERGLAVAGCISGTDGGAGSSYTIGITAACIDAALLATNSVSADELNASGVEDELEAVLDVADLQGFAALLTESEASAAYQPLDSDLTSIAALVTTAYGRGLLTLADAAALAGQVDSSFLTPAEGNAAYQPLDGDLTSWAAVTRASGFDTFAGTATSENLRALLTDEIGTGVLVFLGTPAADAVAVGDSTSATTWRTLPDSDAATQKLQYDAATNTFSAGTDDDIPDAADFTALALTGDVTSSGLATTIAANAVALTTDTSGNYMADVAAGVGIATTHTPGEGSTATIAFDFSDAGADPSLAADQARFTSNATTGGFLVFEGDTANAFESRVTVTDPTADRLMTIPNANSNPIQPFTCPSTDKVSAIDANGVLTCTADAGAAGGGLAAADIDTAAELRAIQSDEVGTGALMFGLAPSMSDDLTCSGSQVVRRNAGDTAFECATISAGGLTAADIDTSAELRGILTDEIGTGVLVFLGAPADDSVAVGDSTTATTWRTLPDSDGAGQKLVYDQATNTFSAGTDDDVPDAADFGALALTGDVTSSGLATTIAANSVALTTDTTGNYMADVSAGGGIAVTHTPGEGSTATIGFDYSDAGADPALAADACRFTANTTVGGYIVCEGDTANTIESRIAFTDPTSTDKVLTIPDADSWPITNRDYGDITVSSSGQAMNVDADAIALTTDTTGNYAAGDGEAGAALTGDSATGFFSTGLIEVARGGHGAAPGSDDQIFVSSSTSAGAWTSLPNVPAGSFLTYATASNSFSTAGDDDVPEAGDFGTLALTGDVTSSGLATTIASNSVALTADTTGNYVDDVLSGVGIVVTHSAGEGSDATVEFDFTDAGASPALAADESRFTSNATTPGHLVFEGDTADTFESRVVVTDPTADRAFTIPNADSVAVQPLTCTGSDKVSAISALGVVTCSADQTGVGGGDAVRVEDGNDAGTFTDATDADFGDSGDINFALNTGATPDEITATVRADSVALTTDTTGNYAAGDGEAGAALTGDSATAFFAAGSIEDARLTLKTESLCLALSDETTSITTGVAKVTMRMPYAFVLTEVRASVNGASSSGVVTVDINEAGATIMTTNKLSIDQSEETSVTAATAAGVTDANLADDAEMTFDIDAAGTSAEGLKVCLIGHQ